MSTDNPKTMTRVRHFLGDECISESWYDANNINDQEWVRHFILETRRSYHPLVRLVISTYALVARERVVPDNPEELQDVI